MELVAILNPEVEDQTMAGSSDETRIRAAALTWLNDVTFGGSVPINRDRLANDFHVDGNRFPLVDRGRGIRKPQGWVSARPCGTAPR